jgi:ubiquinone/menaquinone biosynthesis C-methylase UbiE
MVKSNSHYKNLVETKRETLFASCGFSDRFDPFILNKIPYLRNLYGRLFQSHLRGIPNSRILDIGCGTGIYFDELSLCANRINAIDCSVDMIRIATDYCKKNSLTNIFPSVGSSEAIPFYDESFDIVIELDTLHHINDFNKTLSEIHRILKPGGHFFLFEPNIYNPLTFFAHLIPREERLGIKRNRPGKLLSIIEQKFETVRWTGVCALVTQTKGFKRILLDLYLKFWESTNIEKLYPRQAWLGLKK